jgi:hypothetical protein
MGNVLGKFSVSFVLDFGLGAGGWRLLPVSVSKIA